MAMSLVVNKIFLGLLESFFCCTNMTESKMDPMHTQLHQDENSNTVEGNVLLEKLPDSRKAFSQWCARVSSYRFTREILLVTHPILSDLILIA